MPALRFLPLIMLPALALALGACQSEASHLKRLQQSFDHDWQQALPPGPAGLPIPTAAGVSRAWQLCADIAEKIEAIDPERLPAGAAEPYRRLLASLTGRREFLRQLRHDPATYNLGEHLQSALAGRLESPADPWIAVDTLLHQSASFFDQAKKILENPEYDPTLKAIAQQEQTLFWLENALPDTLRVYPLDDARKNNLRAGIVKARFAVKDYLAYCRSLAFEHQDSLLNR